MSDIQQRLQTSLAQRYTIERELGEGGMATVYLAEDLKHHRKVALKVLKPELAAALGGERFLREIEIAAGLHHPHILALYDSGQADSLLYYTMPFVEGESLRDRLDREKQLSIDEARQIAGEVADALSYAHDRGVVHRDIKPENILLESGHAMVADFGIARAVTAAGGETLTETGLAIGTPTYMSPEQAAGDRDLDARSDVYSLGSVLHEMLMGEPPHTGPNAQAIIAKTMSEPVTSLRTVRTTVPEGLDRTVLCALAKVPADRFASATEFREALQGRANLPGDGRPGKRRLWGTVAITLALVAVLAVALGRFAFNGAATVQTEPAIDKSIVVLPFRSADPEQDYLADGITEALSNLLSRIPEIRVAAPTSAFSFKGKGATVSEIGEALDVGYVLTGSVRTSGDGMRVTVQLVDASSDTQIWSRLYDRQLEDVFAIQDEIAAGVIRELQITLLGSAPRTYQTTPEAYNLFLQAQMLLRTGRATDAEAEAFLDEAFALDPNYVPTLLALTRVYHRYSQLGDKEYLQLARDFVDRVLVIDPNSGQGHSWLGWFAFLYDRDFEAWARHERRALELDPTDVELLHGIQIIIRTTGQYAKAIVLGEFEVARDPRCSRCYMQLGYSYLVDGQLDVAEDRFLTAVTLDAGAHHSIWQGLGMIELLRGDAEAALGRYQKIPSDSPEGALGEMMANYSLGNEAAVQAGLSELAARDDRARWLAPFYAWSGDSDRAFESADGFEGPAYNWLHFAQDPVYNKLHSDPRWHEMLVLHGIAPEQLAGLDLELELPVVIRAGR